MLVPATLYDKEIEEQFKNYFYTDDMLYWTGSVYSYTFEVNKSSANDCGDQIFQYAVINNNTKELIGIICYNIDLYASCVYHFGIFSFKRNSIIFAADLVRVLNSLLQYHRIEWRCIAGNPAEKFYDSICKKYSGRKLILKDCIKDLQGNYHDSYIYEIINN